MFESLIDLNFLFFLCRSEICKCHPLPPTQCQSSYRTSPCSTRTIKLAWSCPDNDVASASPRNRRSACRNRPLINDIHPLWQTPGQRHWCPVIMISSLKVILLKVKRRLHLNELNLLSSLLFEFKFQTTRLLNFCSVGFKVFELQEFKLCGSLIERTFGC